MVGQNVESSEELVFKLMVKGKEPGENQSNEHHSGTNGSKAPSGFEAEGDPDVIRLEVMSDNDFFFQYVYE